MPELSSANGAPQPSFRDLLSEVLEEIEGTLGMNRQDLAVYLSIDPTTIQGWLRRQGPHRPNDQNMHAILKLAHEHHLLDEQKIILFFRLWHLEAGFDEQVIDVCIGEGLRKTQSAQLKKLSYANMMLRKSLIWSTKHMREFVVTHRQILDEYQRSPARIPNSSQRSVKRRDRDTDAFITSALTSLVAFYATFYDDFERVTRCALYTPTELDANNLAMKWQHGHLHDVFTSEKWYGGVGAPPAGQYQGIVGEVYQSRKVTVIKNTLEDARFKAMFDAHQRLYLRNRSLACSPISMEGSQTLFGVLVLDGRGGVFTRHDGAVVQELAELLASLLQGTGIKYLSNPGF